MAVKRPQFWATAIAALSSALVTGGALWAAVMPTLVDRDEVRTLIERESPYVEDRRLLLDNLGLIREEQAQVGRELAAVRRELAANSALLSLLVGPPGGAIP